jgi:hypothetical protein
LVAFFFATASPPFLELLETAHLLGMLVRWQKSVKAKVNTWGLTVGSRYNRWGRPEIDFPAAAM